MVCSTVACGRNLPADPAAGYSQVVVVTPTGMDGTGRAVPGRLGSSEPISVTIEVQNKSGGDITIHEVQALILDSAGTIHARTTLAAGRRLPEGVVDTFRGSIAGSRPEASALGVWTRIRDQGGRPRASTECRPLCLGCDHAATQRACEHFDRLVR
jgi:hypothetical protein